MVKILIRFLDSGLELNLIFSKGFLNRFYSMYIWKILSKLTFSAYLVNLTIVMLRIFSINKPSRKVFFDAVRISLFFFCKFINLFYLFFYLKKPTFFLTNIFYSFFVAFFVHIIFEAPFLRLEKILRQKLSSKRSNREQKND